MILKNIRILTDFQIAKQGKAKTAAKPDRTGPRHTAVSNGGEDSRPSGVRQVPSLLRNTGASEVKWWIAGSCLLSFPFQLKSIIKLRSSIVHSGATRLIPKHLLKIINTIKLQKPTNTVACCMTTFGRRRTACTMVVP